jgi:aminopeptidase-like protein
MHQSPVLAAPATDLQAGEEIYALAARIFPICRSMTGQGVRQTLDILGEYAPIRCCALASGTPVLDWTVPKEWSIRDACIMNSRGERIVDFQHSNLHVVSHSVPVRQVMTIAELKPHVHTLPEQPELVPYRTAFHDERWGFCVSHRQWVAMQEEGGDFEVLIDSTLQPGVLNWGECFLPGEITDEVLISAHICHPSLANDNCSGLALATILARGLARRRTRFSYRIVFVPTTIGSISWLATNGGTVDRIHHGLVISNVGDAGAPTYKKSRRGNSAIDRAMAHALGHGGEPGRILDFSPYGYDERQYCSPGFDLPIGLFQRSQFGSFPEYHTSADNLDFIQPRYLGLSYGHIARALEILERDCTLLNLFPKGEPQLGRRGLYSAYGSGKDDQRRNMAVLWVLNLSDGQHTLLQIAERANLPFDAVVEAADALARHGLVEEVGASGGGIRPRQ